MKKAILVCCAASFISGCATTVPPVEPINGSMNVKIFRKTDPPASCQEIMTFQASSGNGCGYLGSRGTYGWAFNSFRNQVVQAGGNAALITNEVPAHFEPGCTVNAYVIYGIAYRCPEQALR